jgi:radical SAM protein with 4Fe4S-binding SPASM domain
MNRIYVEITNVCNLNCTFCPGTTRPPRFMTSAEFREIARKLHHQTSYLYLHVMGEPLLHPQLRELCAIADEYGHRVCLTTNAVLLPQRGAQLLTVPNLHKVSLSLHSFEGNGGGDLEGYLTACWTFAAAAAQGGILVALRLWNGGGAESYNETIFNFLSDKLGRSVPDIPPDVRGNRTLRKNLFLEQAGKFDWPDTTAPESGVQFCHGLRDQLGVLADGTVVPCCLDHNGDLALGNLLTQELSDILASPRAKSIYQGFSRRMPTEELCRRCGYAARFNKDK